MSTRSPSCDGKCFDVLSDRAIKEDNVLCLYTIRRFKMSKILMILGLGMTLMLGTVERSEAFCLFFSCDTSNDNDSVNIGNSNVTDSNVTAGDGNTSAANVRDSVVVGGDVSASGSNSIGSIGVNKGDISQSNSQSITNQQVIRGNDMRDQSLRGNR